MSYDRVYNFTNENVSCLEKIYDLKNSKVLSIVGSGDQYFASVLGGAKQVDLFDINPTSYLYLVLKFYAIRELTYEEFYKFLVLKKLNDKEIYNKLEKVLPIYALKYYKFLIANIYNKKNLFREDGIDLLTKKNQKYYFKNIDTVIPYFLKQKYYKLQNILKTLPLPNFQEQNILELVPDQKYDVLLTSNIYYYNRDNRRDITGYINEIKKFDIPQIQVGYDWYGVDFKEFINSGCLVTEVAPSSPDEYNRKYNYVYSLKR